MGPVAQACLELLADQESLADQEDRDSQEIRVNQVGMGSQGLLASKESQVEIVKNHIQHK